MDADESRPEIRRGRAVERVALPPGPAYDLREAIYRLYAEADCPRLDDLAKAIAVAAWISHRTVPAGSNCPWTLPWVMRAAVPGIGGRPPLMPPASPVSNRQATGRRHVHGGSCGRFLPEAGAGGLRVPGDIVGQAPQQRQVGAIAGPVAGQPPADVQARADGRRRVDDLPGQNGRRRERRRGR